MSTIAVKRRPLLVVTVILIFAILLDRLFISPFFPGLSGKLGIDPSPVFLDIPLHLPFVIDIIPVTILFFFIYSLWLLREDRHPAEGDSMVRRKKLWDVFSGFFILLVCLLAGGAIYYILQDHLSREVRNGINSFGIQADLYLPFPEGKVVHLRGSMILLVCGWIGSRPLVSMLQPVYVQLPTASGPEREYPGQTMHPGLRPPAPEIIPEIRGFQDGQINPAPRPYSPETQPAVSGRFQQGPKVCYPEPVPQLTLKKAKKKEADLV
jgi:hypothetical protein